MSDSVGTINIIIAFFLYFFCYYQAAYGKIKNIAFFSLLFSFVFLHYVFGEYFISRSSPFNLNTVLLFFCFLFFFMHFLLYFYLLKYGCYGMFAHAIIIVLFSLLNLIPPLTPLIILYAYIPEYLPNTKYPLLNMFVLNVIPNFLFYNLKKNKYYAYITIIFLTMSILFIKNNLTTTEEGKKTKVAIVQVGLYLNRFGNIASFFDDFLTFLKDNPDIDIIAFSENNIFTYKNSFNVNLSEKLLKLIYENRLNDKHHLLLGFSGFAEINNVVTVYLHKNTRIINQKKVLIPFIEKNGVLNRKEEISSEYFWVDKGISNNMIDIHNGRKINTSICYDALFPNVISERAYITFIQSNYQLLDKGYGFERLQFLGGVLSKFSIGMNSDFIINIQNSGGTIVINKDWKIEQDIYRSSKREPFVIFDV